MISTRAEIESRIHNLPLDQTEILLVPFVYNNNIRVKLSGQCVYKFEIAMEKEEV